MYADGVYQKCGTKPRFATSRASGVALVAVLFLVALLSMIAVSVLSTTRMQSQISARQFESIQATETVDSALRQTLIELAAPGFRDVIRDARKVISGLASASSPGKIGWL